MQIWALERQLHLDEKSSNKDAKIYVPANLEEHKKGKQRITNMDAFADENKSHLCIDISRHLIKRTCIGHDMHPDTALFWGYDYGEDHQGDEIHCIPSEKNGYAGIPASLVEERATFTMPCPGDSNVLHNATSPCNEGCCVCAISCVHLRSACGFVCIYVRCMVHNLFHLT